jgi:hypothetical protein
MGRAAAEANMPAIAANCFRAALVIDPDCRPAREGLAALQAAESRGAWLP